MYLNGMCAKDMNVGHPSSLHPFSPARPLIKTRTLALFNTHYLQQQTFRKSLSEGQAASMENGAPQNEGRDPSGFLSQIIGNAVTVKLNSGVVYKGELEARCLVLSMSLSSSSILILIANTIHPSLSDFTYAAADHPRQASSSLSMGT